jgi:hypothetical protein
VSRSILCLGVNGCGCHLFWVLVVHEHVLGGNCHMRVLCACQLSHACLACACRFILWVVLAVILPACWCGAFWRVTKSSPAFRFCKGSLLRTGCGRKLAQPLTLLQESRMPR